jgi:hypothetical protein
MSDVAWKAADLASLQRKSLYATNGLMHRSKRPLGSITKSAASHDVARPPASLAGIGCRWSGRENDRCGGALKGAGANHSCADYLVTAFFINASR